MRDRNRDRNKEAQRTRAEEKFKKAETTNAKTRQSIDSERESVRKKTDRLKAQRLAKDVAEKA